MRESIIWYFILQEMVHAKDPPSHYLNKLRTYLDPKASRSHRVNISDSYVAHEPSVKSVCNADPWMTK